VRSFIPPRIKRIPPANTIHFSIGTNVVGIVTKFNLKLRKYKPNNTYNAKNNPRDPPLTIFKIKKRHI